MNRLNVFSSKQKTWCYRQGFYQYNKVKPKNQYTPLTCKLINDPVEDEPIGDEESVKMKEVSVNDLYEKKSECDCRIKN